ncbi:hypothetical protein GEMRC1_008992 [Eukaryota sp. GEM-RC1]
MLIHTGEKPHECEGCHQRFALEKTLTTHRRRCKALNSKPDHQFQCGVPGCEYLTTTINSMWRHLNFTPSQPVKVHADLPPRNEPAFTSLLVSSDSEGVEYGVSCPICEEEASAKVKDIVFCEGFCKWAFHVECVLDRWDTGTAFVCEECVMLKAHDEKKKIMKNKTLEVSDLSLMWIGRTMNEDGSMSCKSLLTGRPFSIYKAPSTLTNAGNGLFVSGTLIPYDLIAYWRGAQISKKLAKRSFTSYIVQRKDGMYLDGTNAICLGKFANYHPEHNAFLKDFNDVNGEKLVGLYALRHLKDEEVFLSYDWYFPKDRKAIPWFK